MWARNFERCTKCGRDDRKHSGGGLCYACYNLKNYHKNPIPTKLRMKKLYLEKTQEKKDYAKKYYQAHRKEGLVQRKKHREEIHFNSQRDKVLQRDNHTCKCGKKAVVVHHMDGNGRGKDNKNNKLINLVSLCKKCHINIHRSDLQKGRRYSLPSMAT